MSHLPTLDGSLGYDDISKVVHGDGLGKLDVVKVKKISEVVGAKILADSKS